MKVFREVERARRPIWRALGIALALGTVFTLPVMGTCEGLRLHHQAIVNRANDVLVNCEQTNGSNNHLEIAMCLLDDLQQGLR